jgi:alpha-1,2-rhamnosyltransferase
VERYEAEGSFPSARPLQDWAWVGWREASLQLVERTRQGILQQRHLPASDAVETPDIRQA